MPDFGLNLGMEDSDTYIRLEERSDTALMKDIACGRKEALIVLMDRYIDLISRTAYRVLCEREGSEAVTVTVFLDLWKDVMKFDDRFTMKEWLLRKTLYLARMRVMRRRLLRIAGVKGDLFVQASPKVENEDDYVTKQAWELYCRATTHMTPLQTAVYTLCELEDMLQEDVSHILGLTHFRISLAYQRAMNTVMNELRHYGRDKDYVRYVGFLKKVAESLTDREKLEKYILEQVEI